MNVGKRMSFSPPVTGNGKTCTTYNFVVMTPGMLYDMVLPTLACRYFSLDYHHNVVVASKTGRSHVLEPGVPGFFGVLHV